MSGIPAKTLREKSSVELKDQILLDKKRMFQGVVMSASGESIKAHEKRQGRRTIARMQGIISERLRRQELNAQLAKYTPLVKDASPKLARLLRTVEERIAEIKAEKAKPAGQRRDLPLPTYKRLKSLGGVLTTQADRAAFKVAEAKRLLCSIDREDVGQQG